MWHCYKLLSLPSCALMACPRSITVLMAEGTTEFAVMDQELFRSLGVAVSIAAEVFGKWKPLDDDTPLPIQNLRENMIESYKNSPSDCKWVTCYESLYFIVPERTVYKDLGVFANLCFDVYHQETKIIVFR